MQLRLWGTPPAANDGLCQRLSQVSGQLLRLEITAPSATNVEIPCAWVAHVVGATVLHYPLVAGVGSRLWAMSATNDVPTSALASSVYAMYCGVTLGIAQFVSGMLADGAECEREPTPSIDQTSSFAIVSFPTGTGIVYSIATSISRTKTTGQIDVLLRGRVFCPKCGRRMTIRRDGYHCRYPNLVYCICTSGAQSWNPIRCGVRCIQLNWLDGLVWNSIANLLKNLALVLAQTEKGKGVCFAGEPETGRYSGSADEFDVGGEPRCQPEPCFISREARIGRAALC